MEDQQPAGQHCRACGAALAADADWCSLCFAPTAPEPAELTAVTVPVEIAPPPPVIAGPAAAAPATSESVSAESLRGGSPLDESAQLSAVAVLPPLHAGGTWPCLGCERTNPLTESVCGGCGAKFLAAAAVHPHLHLPLVGDVLALTKSQQTGLCIGAGLVFVAVLLAVMTVLGAVI